MTKHEPISDRVELSSLGCMTVEEQHRALEILEFYANPFLGRTNRLEPIPDFYDELDFGERARRFLESLT